MAGNIKRWVDEMMKIMIQGQSVWTCFSLHKWFLASWRNILRASGASPLDPHQGCAPGLRWETSVPQTRPPASAPPKPKYWIRPWFRSTLRFKMSMLWHNDKCRAGSVPVRHASFFSTCHFHRRTRPRDYGRCLWARQSYRWTWYRERVVSRNKTTYVASRE